MIAFAVVVTAGAEEPALRAGDVVLQRSASRQATLVAAATGSEWTHAGLVSEEAGALVVIEAVEPVRVVPLEAWIARSVEGRWAAIRPPIDADLQAVDAAAREMIGRHYDLGFSWDDERLYCSELVRKAFAAGGVDAGELAPVSSFAVRDPRVRAGLAERGIPLDRLVVSPQSLADDADFTRLR